MAYDGSIRIDTAIDGKGFSTGLDKIKGIAKTALTGVLAGVIAVSTAIGAMAMEGVKYNSQMEQYITSFETMLGSADKAADMVRDLKRFAAETPFEFTDLAKGTQTLMAFGTAGEDVLPTLKMLGDVSQGNSEKFDALTLAFAQVSSAGKLTGQDLLQMINAGFNPLQIMAEKSGKSMATLKDEMEKGKISSDMVAEAFKVATSEGGRFFNAMEAQSKTFNGQLSTLKDNAMQFIGDLTAEFTNGLKDTALPMVNGWLTQLSDAFKKDGVKGVASAIGSVVSNAASQIAKQAPGAVKLAVSLIQAFVKGVESNSRKILEVAQSIARTLIDGLVSLLPKSIQKPVNDMVTSIQRSFESGGLRSAIQTVGSLLKTLGDIISGIASVVLPVITTALDLLGGSLNVLLPIIAGVTVAIEAWSIIQSVTSWWGGLIKLAGEAAVALAAAATATSAEAAATALSSTALTVKNVLVGVLTGQVTLATAAQWAWNTAIAANPVGAITIAVVGLAAVIGTLIITMQKQKTAEEERLEVAKQEVQETYKLIEAHDKLTASYRDKKAAIEGDYQAEDQLVDTIIELSKKEKKSATDKAKLLGYVEQLNKAVPDLNLAYDEQTDALSENETILRASIELQKDQLDLQNRQEKGLALSKAISESEAQRNLLLEQQAATEQRLADLRATGVTSGPDYAALTAQLAQYATGLQLVESELTKNSTAAETNAIVISTLSKSIVDNNAILANSEQNTTARLAEEAAKRQQVLEADAENRKKAMEEEAARRKEIYDRYAADTQNFFGRIKVDTALTFKQMRDNMIANQKLVKDWTTNLGTLAKRGLDAGLLQALRDAGPESAGTVQNLVNASDKELARLSALFRKGSSDATKAMLAELGLPQVTNSGRNMIDNVAAGAENNDALKKAAENSVDEAKAAADKAVRDNNFPSVGMHICTGIAQGVRDNIYRVRDTLIALAREALAAAKRELDEHSPSKAFRDEVGRFIPPGISIGVEKAMPATIRDMKAQMAEMMAKARAAISAEQARVGATFAANSNYQLAMAAGPTAGIDYNALAGAFWAQAPKMGAPIVLNGKEVGRAMEPEISMLQADKATRRGRIK